MSNSKRRARNTEHSIFEEEDTGRLIVEGGGSLSEHRLQAMLGDDARVQPDRSTRDSIAANNGKGPILGYLMGIPWLLMVRAETGSKSAM